jgi:hypothetical protein
VNGSEPDVTVGLVAATVVGLVGELGVLLGLVGELGVLLGLVGELGVLPGLVGVLLGLVGVVEPIDWQVCGLYCWHVELCPMAAPGSASTNTTPTSAETLFIERPPSKTSWFRRNSTQKSADGIVRSKKVWGGLTFLNTRQQGQARSRRGRRACRPYWTRTSSLSAAAGVSGRRVETRSSARRTTGCRWLTAAAAAKS